MTDRMDAAEAVCEALAQYEAARNDWRRQDEVWRDLWIKHKVWRATRAATHQPTLTEGHTP